jgi:hypothetical protein
MEMLLVLHINWVSCSCVGTFISSDGSLVASLEFSLQKILSLANGNIHLLFFSD